MTELNFDSTNLVGVVDGWEGTGKTYFGTTAEPPIDYLYGDMNAEDVLKYRIKHDGVKILPQRFDWLLPLKGSGELEDNVDIVAASAAPPYAEFHRAYYKALENKVSRSVVVDTGGYFWELRRSSRFGKLTQVPPIMYAHINAEFTHMLNAARHAGKNAIFIHRVRDEWISKIIAGKKTSEKTGKLEREGFREAGFEVQFIIRLSRLGPRGAETGAFQGHVLKCTPRNSLVGTVLEQGSDLDFEVFRMMVYE